MIEYHPYRDVRACSGRLRALALGSGAVGPRQDLFTILKGYGISAISLRTWVNPSSDPANDHCGMAETVKMAQQCRDAGLQVLIGFHFGDTWNSAGVQNPPAAWANMS